MKLVLIGMMGSGKSTVGRLLAREIRCPFIDTDHLIEAQAGKSIAAIFQEDGEQAFRAHESRVVESLAHLDRVVIASGGGTLMSPANREKLRHNSLWIYLQATPETLQKRLGHSSHPGSRRPLLEGNRPWERLARLLEEREPVYLQADLVIPTGDQSAVAIVRTICNRLPEHFFHQEDPDGSGDTGGSMRIGEDRRNAPPQMEEILVALEERTYPIWIGNGLLDQTGIRISEILPVPAGGKRLAVIIGQPEPLRLYGGTLSDSLLRSGYETHLIDIPDGEQAKDIKTASLLYDRLVDLRADRTTVLFALGGGVAGDLVGFTASTFMRGLPFVQLPTSLLAQVDASIGGKVAVNHPAGKNLIGTFYQPRAVLIDTETLASLPDSEFRNGMAEVIKYALLAGEADVRQLEDHRDAILRHDETALRNMITRCCVAKARVVEEDEEDKGLRMILNLGHTFGHALESLSGYQGLKHGEAVAIGCCLAAELSCRLGLLEEKTAQRIETLFRSYSLPVQAVGFRPDDIYRKFYHDKKAEAGRLRFVLLQDLGRIVVRDDVPPQILLDLLREKITGSPAVGADEME